MNQDRVSINGREVSFKAAVALMDDDIREKLHLDMAPCTDQDFANAYSREHLAKYGEPFEVN